MWHEPNPLWSRQGTRESSRLTCAGCARYSVHEIAAYRSRTKVAPRGQSPLVLLLDEGFFVTRTQEYVETMRKRLEQSLIRPIYAAAIWVRGRYWQLRRPLLFGVRALIVRGDQVLLIRHRAGKQPWAIPGGGVKRYERLEEAARREAWEETGVVVRVDHLLGLYDSFRGGVSNYIAVFACTPLGDPNPPRSLEIAEARFFPHDQLPSGLDRASRQRIAEYYAGQRGVARLW